MTVKSKIQGKVLPIRNPCFPTVNESMYLALHFLSNLRICQRWTILRYMKLSLFVSGTPTEVQRMTVINFFRNIASASVGIFILRFWKFKEIINKVFHYTNRWTADIYEFFSKWQFLFKTYSVTKTISLDCFFSWFSISTFLR